MDNQSIIFLENIFVMMICIYIVQSVDTCNYVKLAISIISILVVCISFDKHGYNSKNNTDYKNNSLQHIN